MEGTKSPGARAEGGVEVLPMPPKGLMGEGERRLGLMECGSVGGEEVDWGMGRGNGGIKGGEQPCSANCISSSVGIV